MEKKLEKSLLLALVPFMAAVEAASAQAPPTVKLCDGTQSNCPLIGKNNPDTIVVGPYQYTPLAPMQTGVTVTASTGLTIPTGSTYGVICVEGNNLRYSTDGTTTPTASVGMLLLQNQCVALSGATVLSNFKGIQAASTATLDVSYFK